MSDRRQSTPPEPLPEPPEIETDLEDVALRRTFAHQLPGVVAGALECQCEQAVTAARESGQDTGRFLDAIAAAAEDLLFVARYLDWFADYRGDGVERQEIPVAAAVLEIAPQVEGLGTRLLDQVAAARGGAS